MQVLKTVTFAVPEFVTSEAVIAAVSCVELTKVVVLFEPFHLTIDSPFTKFVPFTVKVNALEPANAEVGLMLLLVGLGFTVTITSSLLLFTGPNFQLKKGKKVPVPLFPVIEIVPFVIG